MKKLFILLLISCSMATYAQKKKLVTNKGEIVEQEKYDSTANRNLINTKLNTSDTAAMLAAYQTAINGKQPVGSYLVAGNNLADVTNATTARTNLSLGNVNNTSDANKPVSIATQTALDLKAPLISPLFTTPRLASTSTINYLWTATDNLGNGSFQAAPTGMVYPGAGIPLSTGTAWGTSITNNSANWNTAFGWGNHASAGYLTGTVGNNQMVYGTGASSIGSDAGFTRSSTGVYGISNSLAIGGATIGSNALAVTGTSKFNEHVNISRSGNDVYMNCYGGNGFGISNNGNWVFYASNNLVGIGTVSPAASSLLDIVSTTKGLLIPRMTTAQRTAISSPATGLHVTDVTLNNDYYYNGTNWQPVLIPNSSGNVGIGTSAPTGKIHVVGDNAGNPDIGMFMAGNGTVGIGVSYNGIHIIGSGTNNTLNLNSKGTGNINLNATTTLLNTNGNFYVSGTGINAGYSTNATSDFYVNNLGYQGGTTQFRNFRIEDGKGANIMFVDASLKNVGLGTTSPATSLKLDVSSTTQAFAPPRMTSTQASAISSPVDGSILYVTDTNGTFTAVGFWGRENGVWIKL